ncbi:hypothetical protein [Oceanobacillus piezotolerans]|nr:hypothetical protein [Oceanobacillus piezotolerans]
MLKHKDITMFKIDLIKLIAEYKRCEMTEIKEQIKQEIDILVDILGEHK